MLKFKKSMLVVLAVSSSAAFAGVMGPVCSPTAVSVPCETCAWDFGGHALYFQNSSSAYLAQSTMRGTGASFTKNLNPNWNWGFELEASYHFGKGKDINVNWYRLRGSSNRDFTGPLNIGSFVYPNAGSDFVTTSNEGNNTTINYLYQSGNTAWDMVNVELAQHVDFEEHTWGRFHAGVDFSRVAENAYTTFDGTWSSANFSQYQLTNVNGSYNGFGPRAGADLGYTSDCGLGIYGGAAVGLLAGTSKVGYTVSSVTGVNSSLNYNVNRVVTEVDARLGLNYSYQLARGNLSLDAGWMWVNYISPLAAYTSENSGTVDHNFGTQGVYFGAKWLGNFV